MDTLFQTERKGSVKYSFIDLFAGCGGLSEGFMQTGHFEGLAHIEWEKPMVETLRNRLVKKWNHTEEEARKRVLLFDVQKTDELFYGKWAKETKNLYEKSNDSQIVENGLDSVIGNKKVDLIIGGPPCQAYSLAGRAQDPHSMKDDYRNYLFESFVKIVDHYKPKLFVFENVPGILSACPGDRPVIERIFEAFDKIGYQIRDLKKLKKSVYSAADFNTPQLRNRVIIVGVNKNSSLNLEGFYSAIDSEKTGTQKTVFDAIGDMPKFFPLKNPKILKHGHISHVPENDKISIPLHNPRYHSPRDIEVFKEWLENDMNHKSQKEKLAFYTKVTGIESNHIKYRNLEWNKPSPTIVAHLHKDGLMFILPDKEQLRSITIREAALLQSFPRDFEFLGSNAYCFKMIGNAVPVEFAKSIGNAIYKVLNRRERKILNVLVACEESQAVCNEFRRLGHNAYSCDLLNCSGGHPEWHFNHDVLEVIKKKGGKLENGSEYFLPDGENWDLMVAHPPCTFLAVSGARWYYNPEDKDLPIEKRRPHPRFPNRAQDREDGVAFFLALANAPIEHIAIENPVGIMSNRWRKSDQTIQPYMFGDEASKATCLWLKNLPLLEPTKMVGKGERVVLSSGKTLPKWYSDALTKAKNAAERRTLRSKTFPGIAKAIAEQWSKFLTEEK